jgi:hypothetical protein
VTGPFLNGVEIEEQLYILGAPAGCSPKRVMNNEIFTCQQASKVGLEKTFRIPHLHS